MEVPNQEGNSKVKNEVLAQNFSFKLNENVYLLKSIKKVKKMTNSKYTLDSHEYFRFMDLELENLTLRLKLHEMG